MDALVRTLAAVTGKRRFATDDHNNLQFGLMILHQTVWFERLSTGIELGG